jgi:DNA-binding response OmpR family regulator
MGQLVLVVDDDPTVSDVVRRYLERAELEVVLAADGHQALVAYGRSRPDLVVLDLMLPGIDGLEVCRLLRRDDPQLPIVMLTALGDEADRVLGLELGADDYVTKPFSPRELTLRVLSVLRRSRRAGEAVGAGGPDGAVEVADGPAAPAAGRAARAADLLRDGDLVVDLGRRVARLAGRSLPLTVREFELLVFLMRNPGRSFKRAELLEEVWGWTFGDQSTVTVHVRRLREKIETDPSAPGRIVTVWGIGYRYEPVDADQATHA